MFDIRPAESQDLVEMFGIWATRPGTVVDQSTYERKFLHDVSALVAPFGAWVAESSGQVIGFATLTPMRFNPALVDTMAEYGTYVDGRYRRNGVAKALAQVAVECSRGTSLEWILAFVGDLNVHSLALFDNLGWTTVGSVPASSVRQALVIRAVRIG